jgi:predicted nucleic acid-binding protein
MIFADLASGSEVFLDANTFVYHFAPDPLYGADSHALLERIERQDVRGVTATHVLAEFAHRLMTVEAVALFGWPQKGIAYRLRSHANEIGTLSIFKDAVEKVLTSKVDVLSIAPASIALAASISRQWGLLCSDALLIAVMQSHGITNLASNDTDFDRVPGIVRFAPH